MKIYDVEHQSKYGIQLTQVRNIEDAGDHFVTEDDLKEMGITNMWGGHQLFKTKIIDEINRLLSTIKEGRKSCIIDDEDLVDILKSSDSAVSDFVEGTRRVGNRLFRHTKVEKSKPQKQDASQLINTACRIVTHDHRFGLEFKYVSGNQYEPAIKLIKKLVTWKQVQAHCEEWSQETKWMEMVWKKPALFTVDEEDDS